MTTTTTTVAATAPGVSCPSLRRHLSSLHGPGDFPLNCNPICKYLSLNGYGLIHLFAHLTIGREAQLRNAWSATAREQMHVTMRLCVYALCVYAQMRVLVHGSMPLSVSASMRRCVYASMRLCVYVSMCLCVSAPMRLCAYTHRHIDT